MTEHEKLRTDLGAYVLGALPPDEVAVLEAHLATCAGCRAERDDLLPAATVLGELKRSEAAPPLPVESAPPGLDALVLGRLDREAASERRTAWARRAGLAAVAGAAAAVVLVVGLAITRDDPPTEEAAPVPPMELVDVAAYDDGVIADAALVNHTWGVEVKLTATGFADGGRYRVLVVGTDGRRYPAGAFVGTGSREMHCNLNSAVLRPDATGFEVRDGRGDVVVSSTFA
ncbi:anti-sigma factor [Nocardioides sp.]|uniref:anti-sigma factor family protein n=1 Tax=Nocardioides sp. TaxID=35761 RepID=UPI00271A218A|nr:zf-HC2 domain-containing protein [Nocardioides sp.]MDO9457646.1 zf-HC2 domain-containing protein [Nocardioides sp.]